MRTALDIHAIANELASRLSGATFGSTTVLSAVSQPWEDAAGEEALLLELRLSDPSEATWPYEDILEIRRAAMRIAAELGSPVGVYTRVTPETDFPQEDDTADEHPPSEA